MYIYSFLFYLYICMYIFFSIIFHIIFSLNFLFVNSFYIYYQHKVNITFPSSHLRTIHKVESMNRWELEFQKTDTKSEKKVTFIFLAIWPIAIKIFFSWLFPIRNFSPRVLFYRKNFCFSVFYLVHYFLFICLPKFLGSYRFSFRGGDVLMSWSCAWILARINRNFWTAI